MGINILINIMNECECTVTRVALQYATILVTPNFAGLLLHFEAMLLSENCCW